MSIKNDIADLLKDNIISKETAEKIQGYYLSKSGQNSNRLFIVFAVLGAILVGLGIILIIAHNWDELSRMTKTILAFLPLIIGQLLCGFTLIKKRNSIAWRESTSVFLFFAVGAVISLISQIYNIPGNISSFVITWMLLILPLVYLLKSSVTSLLYVIGITYYVWETGYNLPMGNFYYWILLLLILPYYYYLFKKKPNSNFIFLHHWLIPISLLIALGTIADEYAELMFIPYLSLLGIFYLIGHLAFFSKQKLRNNGYLILGSLGTVGLLLALSFDEGWRELRETEFIFPEVLQSPEFMASIFISILALGLLYMHLSNRKLSRIKPIAPIFLLFILIYALGLDSGFAVLLINLLLFIIGIQTIREGANKDHLGILNYGLLIITALVICRFFDSNLSFVLRGVLFVLVGVGFFLTNYWMLVKRKDHE